MLERTCYTLGDANHGSQEYGTAPLANINEFFDFDSAAFNADSLAEYQPLFIQSPKADGEGPEPRSDRDEEHQPLQHMEIRPEAEYMDTTVTMSPDIPVFRHTLDSCPPPCITACEPHSEEPKPQNDRLHHEVTRLEPKKALYNMNNHPAFARFAVWDPKIGLSAENSERRPTKRRTLSTPDTRPKPGACNKGRRKRAQNGAICVRCRLQKGKCVGGFPCNGCTNKIWWKNICVRAKPDQVCFLKEVYRTRVNVMLDNVQRWIPADQEPLKQIRVSIGFDASLPVEVNRFVPVDAALLQQANLRKSAEDELPLSPWRVEPYGLHGIILHADLNKFLEDMIPELLRNEAQQQRDRIRLKTISIAYQRSQNGSRKDSRILRNVLKMWAAQTSYAMDHMWRVSDGADAIGSEFHPGLGAAVVPRCLMWQLDAVMEECLLALEQKILEDFDRLIFPSRDGHREQSTWLSTYLAAYIYLACLETDTWIIQGWKVKTSRWKLDPVVANNPTMQWPLKDDPSIFVEKNTQQARAIVGHIRALSQGRLPFSRCTSDNANGVKPNINSPDEDTRAFAGAFESDFIDLAQKLSFRGLEPYREHDEHSLEYMFLSKLLIHEE